MHSPLAPGAPMALQSLLKREPIALFLDFDGTLVELAERPDAIEPLAGMADRLAKLSDRLGGRCALVSGRAIEDIEQHLGPIKIAIAGSHGSDVRSASGERLGKAAISLPHEVETGLRDFAEEHGVDYEHKAHGGALHYRRNPEMEAQAISFAEALSHSHGLKAQKGKCVIEVLASDSDKASAVRAFMNSAPFTGACPYFLGDDLTDEAGFAACETLGGAGILVGEREGSCAQFRLPDVSSVHTWLEI